VQCDGVFYPARRGSVAAAGVAVGVSFGRAGACSSGSVVDAAAEFSPGTFTGVLYLVRGENPLGSGVRIGGRCYGRAGN
jgi:hypothetical protein